MLYLSDFSSEFLMNASLMLFKHNLNQPVINEPHARYMLNAKTLLQHEAYPKFTFLAGILSEPLEFNFFETVNFEALNTELQYYRFNGYPSILFIAIETPEEFMFILGDEQFDNSVKLELYKFDKKRHLIAVQNHHLKAFEIVSDYGIRRVLNSTVGTHLFTSVMDYSQSHKHQSKYVPTPQNTNVTLVNNNPFKETMK